MGSLDTDQAREDYEQSLFDKAALKMLDEINKFKKSFCFYSKINGTTMSPDKEMVKMLLSSGNIEGIGLNLVREPLNPYDKNAIKVTLDNIQMGYIPRDTAQSLAQRMDSGEEYYAIVSEVTGKDKSNQGCNLEIHKVE